jgi:hypothetical protein
MKAISRIGIYGLRQQVKKYGLQKPLNRQPYAMKER